LYLALHTVHIVGWGSIYCTVYDGQTQRLLILKIEDDKFNDDIYTFSMYLGALGERGRG